MPDITANAPDGTKHIFPDGTDPAVIDRVMKQYITGKADTTATPPVDPFGFSTTGTGGGPEAEMLRRHARSRAGKDFGPEPGVLPWLERQGAGALGAVGEMAQSIPSLLKMAASFMPSGSSSAMLSEQELPSKPADVQSLVGPQVEQWKKGQATTGLESVGHYGAAALPFIGPMAAESGESFGRGEVGRGIVYGAAALQGKEPFASPEEFAKNVSESGRLLKQADAINQAQVQVVNSHVRGPLAQLEAVVNNEIGEHVKAAVDADKAHMASTGAQTGLVNATEALKAANDKIAAMGNLAVPTNVSGLLTEAARPMTLNEAKGLTTDVGRTAAALTRQGNFRQAAVLNELYDGLHKATQARADELGTGKSWQQYINLTRSYKGLQEGLAGELVDEPIHAKVMNKLIDPSRATEWNELRDELQKRGIDPARFEKAREYAEQMSSLLKTTSNLFFGKLRAIIRHPLTAGPIAVGAAEIGHLSGVPGLGFVLPLIAAGKVSGLLDSAAVMKLVKEIGQAVSPEMSRAREALPVPTKPQAGNVPPAPPATTPPPSGPKGGINPKGYEQSLKPVDLADQISAIQQNTRDLKEQMRVASSLHSDEEIQQAEQRMAENDQLVKELKAAMKAKKRPTSWRTAQ